MRCLPRIIYLINSNNYKRAFKNKPYVQSIFQITSGVFCVVQAGVCEQFKKVDTNKNK
jgi:hypothetical protein